MIIYFEIVCVVISVDHAILSSVIIWYGKYYLITAFDLFVKPLFLLFSYKNKFDLYIGIVYIYSTISSFIFFVDIRFHKYFLN